MVASREHGGFMKGVVFTEFIDMVENRFSLEMAERIISKCDLPSGGAYTAVGTYDHREMVALVAALSNETDTPVPTLLHVYGEHLFGRFVALFPQFFHESGKALEFL